MEKKLAITLAGALALAALTSCAVAGPRETAAPGAPTPSAATAPLPDPEPTPDWEPRPDPEPTPAEEPPLSVEQLVGPWHLAEGTNLEALSAVFPGASEFGSGMEIRSDGRISWYVGADGAIGSYVLDGATLLADVTGELDGAWMQVTLRATAPETLWMRFRDVALRWVYGDGGSLRGEEEAP